jgi:hypothetical protein
MGRPGDFKLFVKARVVGDQHVGDRTEVHAREPLRHERALDGSHDTPVVQVVGQLGAASPRVVCNSKNCLRSSTISTYDRPPMRQALGFSIHT